MLDHGGRDGCNGALSEPTPLLILVIYLLSLFSLAFVWFGQTTNVLWQRAGQTRMMAKVSVRGLEMVDGVGSWPWKTRVKRFRFPYKIK